MHYKLDENDMPVTVADNEAWMRWYHDNLSNLTVAKTPIIWLGEQKAVIVTKFDYVINTNHMHGNIPLVWVTVEEGCEKYGTRVATRAEAIKEHERIVQMKMDFYKSKYPDRRKNKAKRVLVNLWNRIIE